MQPTKRRTRAQLMAISLPTRELNQLTVTEKRPKQINGMVVRIPKLVAGTWKAWAISLIMEGIEVIGVRMQVPSRKIPIIRKPLCLAVLFIKKPPGNNDSQSFYYNEDNGEWQ
jgi:hypothetical protein